MAKNTKPASAPEKTVETSLASFAAKFERARTRRAGSILLRLTGESGGDFYLHSDSTGCSMSREASASPPHIEVMGDAKRIRAILDGTKEGRLQFYAGGIRVRGDRDLGAATTSILNGQISELVREKMPEFDRVVREHAAVQHAQRASRIPTKVEVKFKRDA